MSIANDMLRSVARNVETPCDAADNTKDFMGDEKTIEPMNPEALTTLKVGDRAQVKEGILTIDAGAGTSAPSPGPKN